MFTRQHYEAVAQVIRDLTLGEGDRWQVALAFSDRFVTDNGQFDPVRFFDACLIPPVYYDGTERERLGMA